MARSPSTDTTLPPPRLLDSLSGMFWAVLVLVVAFAVWSNALIQQVNTERGAVEQRVGWLMEAQEIDDLVHAQDPTAVARADALADEIRGNAATLAAAADAMRETVRLGDERGMTPLIRAIRVENGTLSTQLGRRWNVLAVLVGIGLFLGSVVLVLLVVVDRRRRIAEAYRDALAEALGKLAQERSRREMERRARP